MSAQHTPGPWVVDHANYDYIAKLVDGVYEYIACVETLRWSTTSRDQEEMKANGRLIAAAPDMLAALDAHAAWALAEESGSGVTWEGRSELANYASWMTRKARALATGQTFDEPYEGVPHMIVWPQAEIHRASEDIAAEMVRQVLAGLDAECVR